MRRDARERRAALIEAAAQCFAESGYGVALEDIAERASVGRGTLYRNFKDRMALVLAIFEREIERVDVRIDPAVPFADTMARLIREGAPANFLFARLASEMPLEGEMLAAFKMLEVRLEELVDPAVAVARKRGEIDPGVASRDLILAVRMATGLLHASMSPAEMDAQIAVAVALLIGGLRPI